MIISMKGMSPLIGSVLVIAITVTVFGILGGWIPDFIKSTQTDVGNKSTEAIECTSADVTIGSVYIDLSQNVSRVSVRNSGFTDDQIISAHFLNNKGEECTNLTALPITFPQGSMKSIEFNITGKITACANFSKVEISTLCRSADFTGTPTCT